MSDHRITIQFSRASQERVDAFIEALTKLTELSFVNSEVTYGDPSLDECLTMARERGAIVKAWVREDLEAHWDELTEDHPELEAINSETKAHIIDQAADSRYFSNLADCTDSYWINVDEAIVERLTAEQITVPGLN